MNTNPEPWPESEADWYRLALKRRTRPAPPAQDEEPPPTPEEEETLF